MSKIHIPNGTWNNQEIELVAGKLVMLGYEVRKGKVTDGEYKGVRYLEFNAQKKTEESV